MKPLLGIEAAASLLAVSPWTIRARIRQGKLKPVRIGRRVLIEEDEIARFLGECKEVAQAGQGLADNNLCVIPGEDR